MIKFIILFTLLPLVTFSQINFNQYFEDKTLRLDYYHTGDSINDSLFIR